MSKQQIVLGLWPIAGVTTIGVTADDAKATIAAALDSGITSFDTAFSYGYDGESDRLIGEAIRTDRQRYFVMGKVGQRWTNDKRRVVDASCSQLIQDAEASLARSRLDYFDVLFLHSPDPKVTIEESAIAMNSLRSRGLCRSIGICNMTSDELIAFSSVAPCEAIQCPLNLVQRESLASLVPVSAAAGQAVFVFWTLMKGLLAGAISRDHVFADGDSRPNYPIFQGELRASIHDAIDRLEALGKEVERTVAQLAIGWTLSQPGVSAALIGARRPEQIRETAASTPLAPEVIQAINRITSPTVQIAQQLGVNPQ